MLLHLNSSYICTWSVNAILFTCLCVCFLPCTLIDIWKQRSMHALGASVVSIVPFITIAEQLFYSEKIKEYAIRFALSSHIWKNTTLRINAVVDGHDLLWSFLYIVHEICHVKGLNLASGFQSKSNLRVSLISALNGFLWNPAHVRGVI